MGSRARRAQALRRDGAIRREQLPLPGGFYGAVEGDADGRLWVLDLVERRVRILDERLARGEIDAEEYRRLCEVLRGGSRRDAAGNGTGR